MFRFEDVRALVSRSPFEPFRVCLSDGRTYDVTHPELCLPGRSTIHVAVPDPSLEGAIIRVDQCALVHVVRVEPLNGNRQKNGKKRGRGSK